MVKTFVLFYFCKIKIEIDESSDTKVEYALPFENRFRTVDLILAIL